MDSKSDGIPVTASSVTRSILAILAAVGIACSDGDRGALLRLPLGTWGGEDAGIIVREDGAHVHVGCTLGDIAGEIPLDGAGRFEVAGTYNVDAFPVDLGILHPARFTGWTDGRTLTFVVHLTDSGQSFSSGVLTFGREPRMRNCPICR